MQQRYERLYSLPGQLYIVGSPVIVDAGALLKDNQTKLSALHFYEMCIDQRLSTGDFQYLPLPE